MSDLLNKLMMRRLSREVDATLEERERFQRALETISSQSDDGLKLDPTWAKRVAEVALGRSRQSDDPFGKH